MDDFTDSGIISCLTGEERREGESDRGHTERGWTFNFSSLNAVCSSDIHHYGIRPLHASPPRTVRFLGSERVGDLKLNYPLHRVPPSTGRK